MEDISAPLASCFFKEQRRVFHEEKDVMKGSKRLIRLRQPGKASLEELLGAFYRARSCKERLLSSAEGATLNFL